MLTLPQELTLAQATACLAQLSQALPREIGDSVVLDASALTRFDSAALAVLLACRRQAVSAKKQLVVQGMPTRLADLAALYGVGALLAPAALSPVN